MSVSPLVPQRIRPSVEIVVTPPVPPHLTRSPDFAPRELFSPSGLQIASDCERAFGYRYLLGWRSPDMDWLEVVARAARRDKTDAGTRSRALGKALHAVGEAYFRVRAIDWAPEPAQRFLPGVPLLPDPQAEEVYPEDRVAFDSARVLALPEPIVWNERCSKDFIVPERDVPLLGDHKTTKDFVFTTFDGTVVHGQKSPEELAADTQLNLYVVDVALRYDVPRVACRWVYYRTDPRQRPAARATDLVREAEPAMKVVEGLIVQAAGLRSKMRDFVAGRGTVDDLAPNPSHCGRYGGCPYHVSKGGPCSAAWDFSKTVEGGMKNMANWRDRLNERTAALAAQAPVPAPAPAPAPVPEPAPEPPPAAAAAAAAAAEVVPPDVGPPAPAPAKRGRPAAAPAPAGFSIPPVIRIEIAIADDTLEALAAFLGFSKAE